MPQRIPPQNLDPGTDGDVMQTQDSRAVWGPYTSRTYFAPLVAVVDGTPTLVLDGNGEVVMTEVPR
jgi:hypothetical protein